jgi:Asp-tRNA(Asn)/Glu-tRNA(Gln) amidotransferase A subunit family amidase
MTREEASVPEGETRDRAPSDSESVSTDELAWTPAWKLRDLMAAKRLSPVELTQHILGRAERYGTDLGAFITVFPDIAIAGAKAAEQAILNGDELGLLHGLAVSVKDIAWTKGQRTTMGSKLLADFVPDRDSVVSERLKLAGATIFAKANMPEFSMNRHTLNLLTREAMNPWDPERQTSTGGSSGGSGAAVAAGIGPISIGSDDGGSIRIPSAFNGIFGLFPSRGRVPNGAGFYGAGTCSVGPMTRDVRDAAMVMQAVAGFDARDPFAMSEPAPDYLAGLDDGVKGMRIAWSPDWGRVTPEQPAVVDVCHAAAQVFGELGAIYEEPSFRLEDPFDGLELDSEYSPAQLDAEFRRVDPGYKTLWSWIKELEPKDYEKLTIYLRDRNVSPTMVEYTMSISPKVRYRAKTRVTEMFERYDLLLSPTIGRTAFPSPAAHVTPWQYVAYTYIVNAASCCAASVPVGFHEGLPVGMQIVGPPNGEARVLRAARAFEIARPWADKRPPLF